MNKTFSNKESIKSGWAIFKSHWKFIIPLGAVTALAQMFVSGMYQLTMQKSALLGFALWMASVLVSIIISLGWAKVFLSFVRTGTATWDTFKTESKLWLHLIKTVIWYMIYSAWYTLLALLPFAALALIGFFTNVDGLSIAGAVGGVIALIVVATYMGIRYQFLSYAVLDFSGLRSKEVFKKAGSITQGSWWELLWFNALCGLITIAGILCIVLGLIIAIPVVKIAQTKVYDLLKSKQV